MYFFKFETLAKYLNRSTHVKYEAIPRFIQNVLKSTPLRPNNTTIFFIQFLIDSIIQWNIIVDL